MKKDVRALDDKCSHIIFLGLFRQFIYKGVDTFWQQVATDGDVHGFVILIHEPFACVRRFNVKSCASL